MQPSRHFFGQRCTIQYNIHVGAKQQRDMPTYLPPLLDVQLSSQSSNRRAINGNVSEGVSRNRAHAHVYLYHKRQYFESLHRIINNCKVFPLNLEGAILDGTGSRLGGRPITSDGPISPPPPPPSTILSCPSAPARPGTLPLSPHIHFPCPNTATWGPKTDPGADSAWAVGCTSSRQSIMRPPHCFR